MNRIQKLSKIPSVSLTELVASVVFNILYVIAFLTLCFKNYYRINIGLLFLKF